MPRSTTKALAEQAASAARKVIGRRGRSTGSEAGSAEEKPAKKAAAKGSKAGEKPAAKKSAHKKAPAKKAPAKKAAAEKAAAKKTSATRATKKAASAKAPGKAPAKRTTAKKTRATPTVTERSGNVTAKKTAPTKTKKAAPSELVVKADEEAWTKEELAEVLEELNEQKRHCLEVLGAQEIELNGLMRDAGDGAGLDQADVGATTFERDQELTVLASERTKLAQIERALLRIDDGTYGICESCGEPIGKMRLMAFPRATLCMTCKQREERR